MTKSIFLLAAVFISIHLAGQATAACDPGEQVIKFTHVTAAKGHPKGEAASALETRFNAELDGKACLKVYPNADLYDDNDAMFQALLDGDVHLAAPSIAKMSSISKRYQVFDLPFIFDDLEAVINFQYTPEGEDLLRAGEEKGFVGLAYWLNGLRQITSSPAVVLPEDADGLRFRISGSPVGSAYFNLLGAETVRISFSKLYDALAEKAVNGQENTWANIYTKQFHTVQDAVTETNHSVIAYMVISSREWLDSLPPDVRNVLEVTLLDVTHEYNRFAFQIGEVQRRNVIADGGVVNELTGSQKDAWRQALKPVWRQFEDEIGVDLIRAAQAANGVGF